MLGSSPVRHSCLSNSSDRNVAYYLKSGVNFQGAPRGGLEPARPSVGSRWPTEGVTRRRIVTPSWYRALSC